MYGQLRFCGFVSGLPNRARLLTLARRTTETTKESGKRIEWADVLQCFTGVPE